MIKKQFIGLGIRWVVNSFGLWVASILLTQVEFTGGLSPIIIAGLVLALVNAVLKPVTVMLSLPFILLTLGLFVLVVNGFMVFIVDKLYSGLAIEGFMGSILAGVVVGLVNYLVTITLEQGNRKQNE